MTGRAAEVETLDRRPILTGAAERPVVADLPVGVRADQQVTAAHVRQLALGIERTAREPAYRVLRQIGRVLGPALEHLRGMGVAHAVPVAAAQSVRELL